MDYDNYELIWGIMKESGCKQSLENYKKVSVFVNTMFEYAYGIREVRSNRIMEGYHVYKLGIE